MLRFCAGVTILAALFNTSALAQTSPAPYVAISGNDVKALDVALGQERPDDLAHTVVAVVDTSPSKVIVKVAPERGEARAFSVDTLTKTVESTNPSANFTGGVSLSGLDAKAISVAYRSWISGAVKPPATAKDLATGSFNIRERATTGWPKQKDGYFITFLPIHPASSPYGLHCADFTNYRVDPQTWRVFIQPKIC